MTTAAEELRDRLAKPEAPKRTVWDIGADLEAVVERIAEAGGEILPVDEAALDGFEDEFLAKTERIFLYAKDCQLHGEEAAQWKAHYAEVEGYWTRKAKGLKGLLLAIMQRYGRDKIQTSRAKFSRVKNPVAYHWEGDGGFEAIPERFRRTKVVYTLDGDEVRKAVAAGETLPAGIVETVGYHIR